MNNWVDRIKKCKEDLPFAIYCTRLYSGRFEFVNGSFAALLRRPPEYFIDNRTTAVSLYREAAQRDDWIELMKNRRGFVAFVAEYLLGDSGKTEASTPKDPTGNEESYPAGSTTADLDALTAFHNVDTERSTIHVIDIAQVFRDGLDDIVVGIVSEYTEQWANSQAMANRIAAYHKILNRIDTGLHEIDQGRRIVFMNRYERELLGLANAQGDGWLRARPDVCELSYNRPHTDDYKTRQRRVDKKLIKGDDESLLTRGEHRSFVKPLSPTKSRAIVPVNIFDERVAEPDDHQEYRNREILTVVVDESIPDDLRHLLRNYGPCNPQLEEVDGVSIATFVKVERQFAFLEAKRRVVGDDVTRKLESVLRCTSGNERDLVFTFGNAHFVSELVALTERDPSIGVKKPDDILGKKEIDLWPNHAPRFSSADREVLREHKDEEEQAVHDDANTDCATDDERWRPDERIEKHPSIDGGPDTDVQVLKLPLYYSEDSDVFTLDEGLLGGNAYRAVGVAGFYWNVSNAAVSGIHAKLRRGLANLYRPGEILWNTPVPIFTKDDKKRFTYANDAYIKDLQSIQEKLYRPINSLYDIIGCTDNEIFRQDRAEQYEYDDQQILDGKKPRIEKREEHGGKKVRVIKTPLRQGNDIVGLQGIFWEEPECWRVRIRWGKNAEPSYLYIDAHAVEISPNSEWRMFELLLQNHGSPVSADDAVRAEIISKHTKDIKSRWRTLKAKLCGGEAHGLLGRALSEKEVDANLQFTIRDDQGGYVLTIDISPSGECEVVS